ncbi:MAG: helix-turn-helix domain-containing protein, partial [bacterium]|nr:helix-turn-helix domain-containing protein [bacterium]
MSVTSVERAFQLLRAVPTSDGTLSGLSRETGLPVATVSRLMSALEKAGAVLRNDEKVYRIGPALVELVSSEPGPYDLLALATAHLSELAAQTNETAGVVEA